MTKMSYEELERKYHNLQQRERRLRDKLEDAEMPDYTLAFIDAIAKNDRLIAWGLVLGGTAFGLLGQVGKRQEDEAKSNSSGEGTRSDTYDTGYQERIEAAKKTMTAFSWVAGGPGMAALMTAYNKLITVEYDEETGQPTSYDIGTEKLETTGDWTLGDIFNFAGMGAATFGATYLLLSAMSGDEQNMLAGMIKGIIPG